MTTIAEECTKRHIDRLFHFTPVDRLHSILKYGLMVPSACRANNTGMVHNDDARLDKQDALCVSVGWPNWALYWRFHLKDTNRAWAIIQIQHRVLWEKRVCFNTTNAADVSMSGLTFEARQGVAQFLKMFDDWGDKKRVDLSIGDHLTTNHQAEVLCLDTIEPAYFSAIHVNNYDAYKAYNDFYPNAKFRFDGTYFKYRSDYAHW